MGITVESATPITAPGAPPDPVVSSIRPLQRDERWFNDVFTTHAKAIQLYFQRRITSDDAEDLAAEVFVTAWRRRETVTDGMELAWLYRVAGFVLANFRRKQRTSATEHIEALVDRRDGSITSPDGNGAEPAEAVAERDRALRALATLSCRDRDIIELSAWDGLNRQELADYLGVSVGGADAALSRARGRLAQAWQRMG